ncbi:glycosyltransferase family 39 protein [Prosthecobacter sp.]|uniref:glycosyltransferase family 39 protein n=1 Tax=Prosthecobacter sp. TaxID=1965333 RepID=UPI0024896F81|nr:glycosyltransferase family 39 protein [Prosthecobacter sp.]MDI1314698.1 glycosyltransferase family 39 protein [Prosthecobacter sp.]
MQRQRFLLAALGLLTLWRWALLPTLELAPGEALAVFCVKHGLWGSFFEMGPLVPLVARLGMLIGGGGEFGVRFFAPLLALAASLMVWRLARELFDEQIAGWAVVIVNVLPAFNLAAVTLTPGTIACVLVPAAALCVRRALVKGDALNRAWWWASACVAGTALAQPPALATMAAVVCVFGLSKRLRHHLNGSGFRAVLAAWSVVVLCWVIWQGVHGWPVFVAGHWLPEWRVIPNVLRWIVLASPLLLGLFVLAVRAGFRSGMLESQRSLPMAMLLPLAALDFFYGPHEGWPDTGGVVWMLFGAMLLAHRSTVARTAVIEQKISLRTVTIVLAALQSAFLLQTDLPRTLGLAWRFSDKPGAETDYTHALSADPSKSMRGWRESAGVVSAVLKQAGGEGVWFVLAGDWRLAVELDHYLGGTEAVQFAASDLRSFAGRSALFVTEERAASGVSDSLKNRFQRMELLSVARVMHAGNEVRWLKIFACHDYRAPDF